MKKIIILIIFILTTSNAFAQLEIEVIPYKIATPTESFTSEMSLEYAKLISIAAAVSKDVIIYPHEKTDSALKTLMLNPQRTITENDIQRIGDLSSADYILIGTLFKMSGKYKSDSVLYSLKEKRILSKSHSEASNIFKLAAEETSEIFFSFEGRKRIKTESHVDATILLDLSFKIASEWPSIKEGIKDFANAVSDNWTIDTTINIVPLSNKYSPANKITGMNSFISVEKGLASIKPAGESLQSSFEKSLAYAVKEIPWRRNSDRIIILVSNSANIGGKFSQRYALQAKGKKIKVASISLGLIKGSSAEYMKEFAEIGSGQYSSVAYRQRVFNELGNPVDVFYQSGRVFDSLVFDNFWKDGLYQSTNKKNLNWEKPKEYLNEILFDSVKYNVTPYNLAAHYPVISGTRTINNSELENNIPAILRNIGDSFDYTAGREMTRKPIAKVQITDGKVSLWIKIKDDAALDFFTARESSVDFYPIGLAVKRSLNDAYGISLDPNSIITEFGPESVPSIIKTSLSDIIKNTGYYTGNGLFNPPFWFVDVKVERIEKFRRDYDIREMNL